ncbi:MAG: hypothetical protein HOP29_14295 [Phycisphaerales bacterium]|nr:hypothetical protein [Phycisphaerales bacterium]
MRKDEVQIGGTYCAKVSGQLARVRIDAASRHGGWDGTNVSTRRKVRIKSAQRLRREVGAAEAGAPTAAEVGNPTAPEIGGPTAEAQSESADDAGPQYDPNQCATPGCGMHVALTHMGKPLCQACWEAHCANEGADQSDDEGSDAGVEGDACCPSEIETTDKENDMPKKNATKSNSAKTRSSEKPKSAKSERRPKGDPKIKTASARKPKREPQPKRVSALDAAAQVLKAAGKPMRAQDLVAEMAAKGLWTSPNGRTPAATLYAAMMREANSKGKDSRFTKTDRGLFAFNG